MITTIAIIVYLIGVGITLSLQFELIGEEDSSVFMSVVWPVTWLIFVGLFIGDLISEKLRDCE